MTLFIFVLLVLATYRIARLISKDLIFEGFRNWLGRRAATQSKFWEFTAELFHCPYCLGVWVAAVFALLYAHSLLEWFVYWMAIAGGQSFFTGLEHA